jgi:hypothetical protein
MQLRLSKLGRHGLLMVLIAVLLASPLHADGEFDKQASWSLPTQQTIRQQLDDWLKDYSVDELTAAKIAALWPDEGGPTDPVAMLDQLVTTLALLDDDVRDLLTFCHNDNSLPREFAFLVDDSLPALIRHNLRLYYGRWLAQHRLYDEALVQLEGLTTTDVVDPASLLFYQSTTYHRLLDKENCLPVLGKLLEQSEAIPRRYATLAQLMKSDIEPLKKDSLDEIARMMDDIKRRLSLGRAGTRVRKEEDDVIAKLDKMIEELEKQQQQQSGGTGPGSLNPSSPAQDSRALGGNGPGNVDPKSTGNSSGWGDLPAKQRQEALQQISKELPAHFREVIEEYFRKLAREGGN